MKEIKDAQRAWKTAKDMAQAQAERSQDFDLARRLGACQMFTGEEDLEALVALMFSPQGAEFLTTYGFPDLATFRQFKPYHLERLGVYIDCGEVELSDADRVFLVGNTQGRLRYTATQGNRLVVMCGARAEVVASGYAVVKIEADKASHVDVVNSGHARVMR